MKSITLFKLLFVLKFSKFSFVIICSLDIIVLVKNSSKGFGQIAFSGSPSEAKDFFEVTEYVQILEKLNLAEEGGNGDLIIQETQERQVMYYINKFQRYRATKLQKK